MRPRPTIGLIAAATATIMLLCGVTVVMPLLATTAATAACKPVGVPASLSAPLDGWNAVQQRHASIIVTVGKKRGMPPRGWVVALATAMQESSLLNQANSSVPKSLSYPHDRVGHDHDSLGLFQQRVSPPDGQGSWGSVEQLMDPATAATKFYNALSNVAGWQHKRLTDAAQAVQRSAFPEAYQKWEHDAERLAATIAGISNIDDIGGGTPLAPCGPDAFNPVTIGVAGWILPVQGPINSGFRTASRPGHNGIDIGATKGTPIRSASAGTVTKVRCESGSGTCDRDGGIGIGGCGWYIEIRHPSNVVTRYCHLVQRPEVQVNQSIAAGQVVGFVGSSGNSSGPHLHFEIHVAVPLGAAVNNDNSTDPREFLRRHGVEL